MNGAVRRYGVTGLTLAILLLRMKAIFFFADYGYPDFNRADANGNPLPPYCQSGPDCSTSAT